MKRITDEVWKSLSTTADQITTILMSNGKLPGGLQRDYVKSQVYSEIGYLVNNFKEGPLSLKNYCWKYAPLRVIAAIWKEYSELNDSRLEAYDEFDNEDNTEKHQYFKMEYDPYVSLMHHIETKDLMKQIREMAGECGFSQMLTMMKNGMSERDIAEVLGTSQKAVHTKIIDFRKTLISKGITK